jgi:formate hydrogenlyase transcriptional activator
MLGHSMRTAELQGNHDGERDRVLGTSAAMRALLAQVAKVAASDATVLLLGETGTGKELIASAIQRRSARAAGPFVRVNCAAVPPDLIASELFGHERGAFTGALQRRVGRFEQAHGGTIFLDEVGELSLATQVALLRVLQEREIERLGGERPIPVDVRVIAATNRDLVAAIAAGTFRADLYFRLNVVPLHLPPLRARGDDVVVLTKAMVDDYGRRTGRRFRGIGPSTLEALRAYAWPGNVRELQNVVERAAILCDGDVFMLDDGSLHTLMAADPAPAGGGGSLTATLAAEERRLIEAALRDARGRIAGPAGAARRLGVPPSTLESKIAALAIDKRRYCTALAAR